MRSSGEEALSETLYFEADAYFDQLLASIAAARKSVHFETFIFENGALGDRVIESLVGAARRGVRVRLLVDGFGSLGFSYEAALQGGGVEFHYFHSFSKYFGRIFRRGWAVPAEFAVRVRGFFRTFNRRNHRKLCLIDGEQVWIGGINVSSLELRSVYGDKAWRDTGARLTGLDTSDFEYAFLVTWFDRNHPGLKRGYQRLLTRRLVALGGGSPLRTNLSQELRQLFGADLRARLGNARTRIWLTTPYFIPPRPLLQVVIRAARRGVDVRLLVPGVSDVPVVSWVCSLLYPILLAAGVRVFEYQPAFLHAKTIQIDGWSMLGSSNLNHRSALHDIEGNYATSSPSVSQALEARFLVDVSQSVEVGAARFRGIHWLKRWLARGFVSFKYWM